VLCGGCCSDPGGKIVILKSARSMTLFSGGKILKTYKVALGSVPVGPKRVEGDHKTPEGDYVIDAKNSQSQFHLSLHIFVVAHLLSQRGGPAKSAQYGPIARRSNHDPWIGQAFRLSGATPSSNRLDGRLHRRDECRD
jgi:hypothetical protein